ncbi:hypothetical protein J3R30DRAFT_3684924 [Lentinula aciculospora]|uniref:Uncharacterized protein n=1 Tax=Lentinula aciculospora TaxID=153920 RepID=A0A9W9DJ45_9AGAR|nr:hypothetical protein J3R30DRAFT_3684924 [Lentinula aciculospora]
MRATLIFVSLFLGLVSIVFSAPLPVHVVAQRHRRSIYEVGVTFIDNSDSSNENEASSNFYGLAQSLLDQKSAVLGLPDEFMISVHDVPTKRQTTVQLQITGGTKCLPTLPCKAVFPSGSVSESQINVNVTIRGDKVVFDGPVNYETYNSARFVNPP